MIIEKVIITQSNFVGIFGVYAAVMADLLKRSNIAANIILGMQINAIANASCDKLGS